MRAKFFHRSHNSVIGFVLLTYRVIPSGAVVQLCSISPSRSSSTEALVSKRHVLELSRVEYYRFKSFTIPFVFWTALRDRAIVILSE